MPGTRVRPAASTWTPRSSRPLPRSQLVAGSVPMPTTTASQSTTAAVVELDRRDRRRAVQTRDASGDVHRDALLAVQLGEPAADARAEHRRERRFGGFHDRDLDADACGGGGDLLSDKAGADHGEAAAGNERVAQAAGVVDRPQHVDVVEALGAGQRPRRAAGGDQQLRERQAPARVEHERAARDVERGGAGTGEQVDVVLGVPVVRAEAQVVVIDRSGQVLLGERRAVVGRERLAGDEADRLCEAAAAQGLDCALRRQAAAGDHDARVLPGGCVHGHRMGSHR